jgi:hypothetical protein
MANSLVKIIGDPGPPDRPLIRPRKYKNTAGPAIPGVPVGAFVDGGFVYSDGGKRKSQVLHRVTTDTMRWFYKNLIPIYEQSYYLPDIDVYVGEAGTIPQVSLQGTIPDHGHYIVDPALYYRQEPGVLQLTAIQNPIPYSIDADRFVTFITHYNSPESKKYQFYSSMQLVGQTSDPRVIVEPLSLYGNEFGVYQFSPFTQITAL